MKKRRKKIVRDRPQAKNGKAEGYGNSETPIKKIYIILNRKEKIYKR